MNRDKAIDALFQGEVLRHPLLKGKVIFLDTDMKRPVIFGRDGWDWDEDPFQFRHRYEIVEELGEVDEEVL